MELWEEEDVSDPEKAQALAQAIRQQRAVANLAMLTGDPRLSRFGQVALQDVGQREQLLAQTGQRRLTRALEAQRAKEAAAARAIDDDRAERALRGTEDWRQWQKEHPAAQVFVGQGGGAYTFNPRDPQAGASPVPIASDAPPGPQVAPPQVAPRPGSALPMTLSTKTETPRRLLQANRPLDTGTGDKLAELSADIDNLGRLRSAFKAEYAGGGPVGSFVTGASARAGGLAPEKYQQQAAWWADFNRLVDLPARNRVFGASLSANELASWEAAKNVKPGADPKLAQAKLEELHAIARKNFRALVEKERGEGTNPAALEPFERRAEGGAPAAETKAVVESRRTPDGRTLVRFSDGTLELR